MQTLSRRGRVSDGGQMTFPFLKVTKFPNDVLFFHRISLHPAPLSFWLICAKPFAKPSKLRFNQQCNDVSIYFTSNLTYMLAKGDVEML